MGTKRCTKCGEVKALAEFSKNRTRKDGLHHRCKCCRREYDREYRIKNRENVLERQRKYCAENREKELARVRKYCAENREKVLEKYSEYNRKRRENLAGGYLASLLKMPLAEAPPELIELKREQLKIHRLIKEAKDGVAGNGD